MELIPQTKICRTIFVPILMYLSIGFTQDTTKLSSVPPTRIELKTFVENSKVPLNGRVIFHIELSWVGDLSRYRIESVPQPILTNLLMEGSGSSNKLEPLSSGKSRAVKTIFYQFKPMELGMAYIDGIVVKYRDQLSGTEDALQSQRVMVEISDPVPEAGEGSTRAVIYIILLIVFFSAIAYFLVVYIKKRREISRGVEPEISPAEFYLQRLTQDIDAKSGNLNEMTSRLFKLFREFISKEFQIPAREASSSELLAQLESLNLNESDLASLKILFEKLDIIRFSGRNVDPAEFSGIYGTIENFLIKRKQNWDTRKEQLKEV